MRLRSLLVSALFALAVPLAGAWATEEPAGETRPGVADTPASPGSDAGLASALNDFWITAMVKGRLLRDDEVPGMAVDVDSREGVVTLFGMVSSESARAAAELQARKTGGVHRVENLLEVVPEPLQDVTREHDRALENEVRDRLVARGESAGQDLDVQVCNSVARVRGRVESGDAHRMALEAVGDTDGVRHVVDQIRIDGAATRAETAPS